MLEIKNTDKVFYDSPNAGDPNCLCSRCSKAIPENEIAIRAWPDTPGEYGYDASAPGGTELRFCEECCEKTGMIFAKSDDDYYDEQI